MHAQRRCTGTAVLFLTSVPDEGGWSIPRPGHFTPW